MTVALDTKTISSQCQVVVFAWKQDAKVGVPEAALSEATAFDVSNYITSVSMSKTMDSPAGQFQFTLANDRDWKDIIKKGMWLLIYCSNEGDLLIPKGPNINGLSINGSKVDLINPNDLIRQKSKLRMMGKVDTIRAQGTVGAERGDFNINFVVSGRNYGAIYEETDIWHNTVLYDKTLLETAETKISSKEGIKTVNELLTILHDLFFAPQKITPDLNKSGSLTSLAKQWLLPSTMLQSLGINLSGATAYYGNIPNLLNFDKTPATYPVESPTALLNGLAWNRLKAHSIEPYHDLFVELNDNGEPRINFRLMPLVVDSTATSKFPLIDSSANVLFRNIKSFTIPNIDIIEWDLGEDEHTRFNLFWSTISSTTQSRENSKSTIGDNSPETGFPRIIQNSVRRHGLRKVVTEVNANIIIGKEKANTDLLRQFNEFSLEIWKRAHDYESGTMTIIGNNNVRLGKVAKIDQEAPYNAKKVFYIEGYEESFLVGDQGESLWTQTLFLTKGVEEEVLKSPDKVEKRINPYIGLGEFTKRSGK